MTSLTAVSPTPSEVSARTPGTSNEMTSLNGPAGSAPGVRAAPGRRPHLADVDSRTLLATSGFVMLTFVVLHLGGNLLAFAGRATFNAYSHLLREFGSPLVSAGVLRTLARVGLAAALVDSFAGEPLAGASGEDPGVAGYMPVPPGYAARPLLIVFQTGVVILAFLVLHLAQLAIGTVPGFEPADPYHNLITTLQSGPVMLAYLAAAVAVGAHLLPGVWTGMRSLRLIQPRRERLARVLAPAIALTTALGLAAVPAAVLLGILN